MSVHGYVTAFILLTFMIPGLYLNVSIILYVSNPIGYKSWVSTFTEDWTPGGKRTWWLTFQNLDLATWMAWVTQTVTTPLKAAWNKIRYEGRDSYPVFTLTSKGERIRARAAIPRTDIPEPRDVHHSDPFASDYCMAVKGG